MVPSLGIAPSPTASKTVCSLMAYEAIKQSNFMKRYTVKKNHISGGYPWVIKDEATGWISATRKTRQQARKLARLMNDKEPGS